MQITIFPTVRGDIADTQDITWPEILTMCQNPKTYPTKQACPLIKLASFSNVRTQRGSLRHDANVLSVSGLEGDYDAGKMAPKTAAQLLQCVGIEAVIYTSPSHTADAPRWRVLAPLSSKHQPSSRRDLLARLNGALGGILAHESFTLSQTYYIGCVVGVAYENHKSTGACIDLVQELPSVYPLAVATAEISPQANRTATPETITDLRSALTSLSADDYHEWISVGQALVCLGDVGYELWADWSATSEKHNPDADLSRWGAFTGDRTGFAAIFAKAQRNGWENPKRTPALDLAAVFGANPIKTAPAIRYKLLSVADLCKLPPLQWRIKKVLPQTGLAAIYGASGSGKSFLVLDALQALAAGCEWFGYKTKPCNVLYCALEGEGGIAGRVSAYRIRHGATAQNIRYLVQPFSLLDVEDITDLAQAIKAAGQCADVVVLDTLNRAAPGADENDSKSMRQIIAASKELQTLVGGLVVLVHHTGKDASKGLRGHSSLHAALDTAIGGAPGGGPPRMADCEI